MAIFANCIIILLFIYSSLGLAFAFFSLSSKFVKKTALRLLYLFYCDSRGRSSSSEGVSSPPFLCDGYLHFELAQFLINFIFMYNHLTTLFGFFYLMAFSSYLSSGMVSDLTEWFFLGDDDFCPLSFK